MLFQIPYFRQILGRDIFSVHFLLSAGLTGLAERPPKNKVTEKLKSNEREIDKWNFKISFSIYQIFLEKSLCKLKVKMSSRGRPPKNGTPFDRLLKKQCQKGINYYD